MKLMNRSFQNMGLSGSDKFRGDSFPSELEKAFQDDYFHRYIRHQRRALLSTLLITMVFGLLHIDNGPHTSPILLTIHYLVLCPALFAIYVFSFHPGYQRLAQPAIMFGGLIFGFTFLIMELIAPTPANSEASQTTVVLILVMIAACIVLRMQYIYAVWCSCIIFVAYTILSFTIFHLPHAAWNVGALFVAYLLESFGVALLEKSARSDFLLRRELAEQNQRLNELAASRLQAALDVEHEIRNKLIAVSKPMEIALLRLKRGLDTGNHLICPREFSPSDMLDSSTKTEEFYEARTVFAGADRRHPASGRKG